MKTRPESKLVTEDPDHAASKTEKENPAANNKTKKRPDSKIVTEDPDKAEPQSGNDAKVGAGGSPSAGAVKGGGKHQDDSKKGSSKLKKESINKSEQQNLTQKKGYNEVPNSIPVKSGQ